MTKANVSGPFSGDDTARSATLPTKRIAKALTRDALMVGVGGGRGRGGHDGCRQGKKFKYKNKSDSRG